MSTPEGKVKARVKKLLDEHGAWHNWPVPAGYGIPMLDCVGCHRGEFFAVETKAPGQHMTPRQQFTKDEMEKAGGKVFVIGVFELNEISVERDPDTWPAHGGEYSGMAELEAWLKRK